MRFLPLLTLLAACSTIPDTEEGKKEQATFAKAKVAEFKAADPAIADLFDSAYAYAIFPAIKKGGAGFGGAFGRGGVIEKGLWIGYSDMTQATIGFQLGGQSFSEVIFFEHKAAFDKFIEGEFEFAATVSAVAADKGAAAKANYQKGMLVFIHADKGLMYEATVGGQKFRYKTKN